MSNSASDLIVLCDRTDPSMEEPWHVDPDHVALQHSVGHEELWESVCLRRIGRNKFELSLRCFEFLGSIDDYWNYEIDSLELPARINGKNVNGCVFDSIVGGDLKCIDPEDLVFFERWPDRAAIEWLIDHDYSVQDVGLQIQEELEKNRVS